MSAGLVISSDESDFEPTYKSHFLRAKTPDQAPPIQGKKIQNIECFYTDYVNIEKVSEDVLSHLRSQSHVSELSKIKHEIAKQEKELEEGLWTFIQFKKKQELIAKLKKDLQTSEILEEKYRTAIKPIIERWKTCSKKPDSCFLTEIDECISRFAKITSEFIPMTVIKIHSSNSDLCFDCGRTGTMTESLTSSGQLYCKECKSGRQVLSYNNGRETKNDDSSGGEDDATETDRISLILKRFQGKQPQLPQTVYDSIKKYLNSRSVLKQDQIRELILKNPGERYGTSRSLLQEAMRATGNERAYKDINAVAANIWGWELPILIQEFEHQIISDYKKTQAFYPLIRGMERKSRLNADYRLLRHLVTRGFWHPIMNDYLGPVTAEVIEYHSNIWEIMCKLADLPIVPLTI